MPSYKTPGVYVEETASESRTIESVPTTITAFIGRTDKGPLNKPVSISNFSEYETTFGKLSKSNMLAYSVKSYFDNGGKQAVIIRPTSAKDKLCDTAFIGASCVENNSGLYALEKVDHFNLLVIPPFNEGIDIADDIIHTATEYCVKRKAFFIIDSPPSWTDSAKALSEIPSFATHSKNAALFFPWLQQRDPENQSSKITIPPSGAVAGIFVRTDEQRGVWKAPAGGSAQLNNVVSLNIAVSDSDNSLLNTSGINCLRNFQGMGNIIWGSRSLTTSVEWTYIPVVRTALFIEDSITKGIQWAVFEPNDARLWSLIRTSINSFLNTLFREGAFQGSTASDTYYVRCALGETMTQADIDNNRLILEIGFAALKPAEFIVIRVELRLT